MLASGIWGQLLGLLPSWGWLVRRWQGLRHPPRVELGLSWNPSPDTTLAGPTVFERIITVEIVAGKTDEFVVADAEMEARAISSDDWTSVVDLTMFNGCLIEVEANRAWRGELEGWMIAPLIEDVLDPKGPVQLRVTVQDYHGTTIESGPVETSVRDLLVEKTEQHWLS